MTNREIEEFWPFIARSVDRLVALLDGLSEKELNWQPLENANSLYALAVHTMGNVEENLLGVFHRDDVATRFDWYEVEYSRKLQANRGERHRHAGKNGE